MDKKLRLQTDIKVKVLNVHSYSKEVEDFRAKDWGAMKL